MSFPVEPELSESFQLNRLGVPLKIEINSDGLFSTGPSNSFQPTTINRDAEKAAEKPASSASARPTATAEAPAPKAALQTPGLPQAAAPKVGEKKQTKNASRMCVYIYIYCRHIRMQCVLHMHMCSYVYVYTDKCVCVCVCAPP